MGIDLQKIDTIIFSHGHNDHTAGFEYMVKKYDMSNVNIVAHPTCFCPKMDEGERIGSTYETEQIRQMCKLNLSSKPFKISKNITFLGEIPARNDFENRKAIGTYQFENKWLIDYVMEDSAIVYQAREGLIIISGCAHSGICNMIEYAKQVCNEERILGVIGGFHLFDKDEVLEKTIDYFQKCKIENLYPCHCVSFQVKARMNEVLKVNEVGVGMILKYK
jgi:7,8-dihydropterin-6-yl-methyl-4-(beta-D-ribofuranosyl)aminobenzene 5'-phosphate synthase